MVGYLNIDKLVLVFSSQRAFFACRAQTLIIKFDINECLEYLNAQVFMAFRACHLRAHTLRQPNTPSAMQCNKLFYPNFALPHLFIVSILETCKAKSL